METRSYLILSGQLLLAATIISSTLIVTHAFKEIKFGRGTISVKGCAEREIRSDFVKWHGSISASAPTQTEAYEKLEKDLQILQSYFQGQGISANQVEFSSIQSRATYEQNEKGHSTNKIESYDLNRTFSFSSSDIPLATKVSQDITTLIKSGLTINSEEPKYFYLKIDELKINMLGEAAKDARQRAEQLVSKSSGSAVGTLRSAQQGVFQITPAFSTSVSDYGEFDTSSIVKRIKAVVTMEYGID